MYHDLVVKIALETIKRHGYDVPMDCDAYEKNPVIRRYFSDAAKALETIDNFLSDNGVTFGDLNVSNYRPQPQKTSQPDQVFPTWERLSEWVDKLYKFWNCDASDRYLCEQHELDRKEALKAYMSLDQLVAFYNHLLKTSERLHKVTGPDIDKTALVIVRMLDPHPGKIEVKLYFNDEMICVGGKCCDHWGTSHGGNYTREIACVIPEGLNPVEMSLTEILQQGKDAPIELFTAPKTQPVEPIKTEKKPADESRIEQYKKGKLLEVQLYFDSSDNCLGVHGKNFITSYKGMFAYTWAGYIKAGLNPIGEHIINILGPSAADDFKKRSHEPRYTHPKELKKSERELMQCFVGREIEFERFLTIKKYLLSVEGMKVGSLISSESDIKSWFVTSGKDKAALYFTSWDGWEIDTRQDQDELTGVFEDFDLIQALEQNDIEVNGISANDWHNARDEKAEAEAVELQQQEKAAKLSEFYKRH